MDLVESAISEKSADRHPWESARKKVVLDLINSNLSSISDSNATILDIGCGDSWLIEQLSHDLENASFTAVDTAFSEEMIANYRKKFDQNKFSFYRELEEANRDLKKVDLILLLDVIEHIEDEIGFMSSLKNYGAIDENTNILITVPAFQSLFCAHDTFLGHFRRYTNKSLKERMEKAGLKVERTGYFFSSLLLPRAIIKLLEKLKLKSTEVKGIGDHKRSAMDPIIENTLWVDYRIARWMEKIGLKLPGLSNFAIVKLNH